MGRGSPRGLRPPSHGRPGASGSSSSHLPGRAPVASVNYSDSGPPTTSLAAGDELLGHRSPESYGNPWHDGGPWPTPVAPVRVGHRPHAGDRAAEGKPPG